MTSRPNTDQLNTMAQQAERDLNSYESKTGNNRDKKTGLEDAGVSDVATKKFPGSSVQYGNDLVTNAGMNRPSPPDEGGDVDDDGMSPRAVEGGDRVPVFGEALEEQQHLRGGEAPRRDEAMEQGRRAAKANLGRDENDAGEVQSQGKESRRSAFRGADYELAGSVPDQHADMGNVEVASAVGMSRRVRRGE